MNDDKQIAWRRGFKRLTWVISLFVPIVLSILPLLDGDDEKTVE
jgi:hypothetical protein